MKIFLFFLMAFFLYQISTYAESLPELQKRCFAGDVEACSEMDELKNSGENKAVNYDAPKERPVEKRKKSKPMKLQFSPHSIGEFIDAYKPLIRGIAFCREKDLVQEFNRNSVKVLKANGWIVDKEQVIFKGKNNGRCQFSGTLVADHQQKGATYRLVFDCNYSRNAQNRAKSILARLRKKILEKDENKFKLLALDVQQLITVDCGSYNLESP